MHQLLEPCTNATYMPNTGKQMLVDNLISDLMASTYALPIDIFRVLVGLLSFTYFLRTYAETQDFSSPDGLIDHELCQDLYPATRLSLFQHGYGLLFFQFMFILACVASVLVILGSAVKMATAFLFLIAVSTYRWNFLVLYVDDAIMHLLLFWLLLLPVGHTLVLEDFLVGRASFDMWKTITVPGFTMRLFLFNLGLLYLTAGLWKWTSPMWRNGTALYAVLKMAISRGPQYWQSRHLPFLRIMNYTALVVEPIFPLMFLLSTNSIIKWILLTVFIGFHAGIIITMKIPFANIAMLGSTVIIFRNELMNLILKETPLQQQDHNIRQPDFSEIIALSLVICLTLMVIWDRRSRKIRIPLPKNDSDIMGFHQNPMYGPLWVLGMAQSFRLFDWIDDRNYHCSYEIVRTASDEQSSSVDVQELFPLSTRNVLLQSYLFGNLWRTIDPSRLGQLRHTIFQRYARRYCHNNRETSIIEVFVTVQRVTSDNLSLNRGIRRLMMRFACQDGKHILYYNCLTPERFDHDTQSSILKHRNIDC